MKTDLNHLKLRRSSTTTSTSTTTTTTGSSTISLSTAEPEFVRVSSGEVHFEASGSLAGHPPELAFDLSDETTWESGELGSQWVGVNFGSTSTTTTSTSTTTTTGSTSTSSTATTASTTTATTTNYLWSALRNEAKVARINREDGSLAFYPVSLYPNALAIDQEGNLWVSNQNSSSVTKIPAIAGGSRTDYPIEGTRPKSIAIDPLGNVWFTCSITHRIYKLEKENNYLKSYFYVGPTLGILKTDFLGNIWAVWTAGLVKLKKVDNYIYEKMFFPIDGSGFSGLAIDQDRTCWTVADNLAIALKESNDVYRTDSIVLPVSGGTDLCVDQFGDVWIVCANAVVRLKKNENYTPQLFSSALIVSPLSIAIDYNGDIYVSLDNSWNILRFKRSSDYSIERLFVGNNPTVEGDANRLDYQ